MSRLVFLFFSFEEMEWSAITRDFFLCIPLHSLPLLFEDCKLAAATHHYYYRYYVFALVRRAELVITCTASPPAAKDVCLSQQG